MTTAQGPFHVRRGVLHVEDVSLDALAKKHGTPLYVYSAEKIRSQFKLFDKAFAGTPHTICYALKANSNLSILALLRREGAGMDIVSGGELRRAQAAGVRGDHIVFSGVGKTAEEMASALRHGIRVFNVESEEELGLLAQVAKRLKKRAPVALRVNPNVRVDTHRHIATGQEENKFGVPFSRALEIYTKAARSPWLDVVGVQAHIGSQILQTRPYRATLIKLLALVKQLNGAGIFPRYLDVGGGLGVPYHNEIPPTPEELAKALLPLLRGAGMHLLFEPGRFLVAEAGCLLTRVLYRKEYGHKNFIVVDAAMNDLVRPALYDAYHPIWPVRGGPRPANYTADIVGPVCESGDTLAKARRLPRPRQGDLLAVLAAGAYGFSMSSQYNTRPRAAEVLVQGRQAQVIRRRETVDDILKAERIRTVP